MKIFFKVNEKLSFSIDANQELNWNDSSKVIELCYF